MKNRESNALRLFWITMADSGCGDFASVLINSLKGTEDDWLTVESAMRAVSSILAINFTACGSSVAIP